jgi:hypothetical protein
MSKRKLAIDQMIGVLKHWRRFGRPEFASGVKISMHTDSHGGVGFAGLNMLAGGTTASPQFQCRFRCALLCLMSTNLHRCSGYHFFCFQPVRTHEDRSGYPGSDSGSSSRKGVEVQVLSSAPTKCILILRGPQEIFLISNKIRD